MQHLTRKTKANKLRYQTLENATERDVFLVIRTSSGRPAHEEIRQLLRRVGLTHPHTAVFLRASESNCAILKKIAPYVAYGKPELHTVRELISKRGYARINGKRVPLSDNTLIEEHLGQHGVICLEDIIHDVFKCSDHFEAITEFLWPFKLSNPVRGYGQKRFQKYIARTEGKAEDASDVNKMVEEMI